MIYTYPILVALFSFLFLNEAIPLIGYIGMIITVTGVVMLSTRLKKLSMNIIIALCVLVFVIAVSEVLIKVATTRIDPIKGVVISSAAIGLVMIAGLFVKKIRTDVKGEVRNLPIAAMGSVLFYAGAGTLFMAMMSMPATIVASIAAIQPLIVLIFERIVDQKLGKISKDMLLLPKLGAIVLIVIGVVMIYIAELIRI